MKYLFFSILTFCLLFASPVNAKVPVSMQFQGFLTDPQGEPLSGEFDLSFTLYGSADGEDQVWTSTKSLHIEQGLFNTILGGTENPLDANVFNDEQLWLGIRINGDNELSPRQPISSVPYATKASIADNALSEEEIQTLIDQGGFLSEETDPTVNDLAKASFSCLSEQIPKWNGTNWVCANDNYSPGSDTLLELSCPEGQIAKMVGGQWNCASDEAGIIQETDPQFSTSISAGITTDDVSNWNTAHSWGDHAVEGYVTDAYNNLEDNGHLDFADSTDLVTKTQLNSGYAQFASPQIPRLNTRRTVDDSATVGSFSSITLGSDGYPVVAYYDSLNNDLKVAKCSDLMCNEASTVTVDSDGNVGKYASIMIGKDGFPVISYHDETNGNLKVAKCTTHDCSGATTTSVTDSGNVAETALNTSPSSMTIGANGYPIISYYDSVNQDLYVAQCENDDCALVNSYLVDSTDDVGKHNSISIGIDGLPIIAYRDQTAKSLKVAKCTTIDCSGDGATITVVDNSTNVGNFAAITIGNDGLPIIAYQNYNNSNKLVVLKCGSAACDSGNQITTLPTALIGYMMSITIAPDGIPVIASRKEVDNQLSYTRCGDTSCSANNNTVLLSGGIDSGLYPSIVIGPDGLPIVSFLNNSNDSLSVFRCANIFCLQNWIRH